MPSTPRPHKAAVYIEVPPELKAELDSLARERGTTFTAEAITAFRRHLACPPPRPEAAPLPPPAPPRPRGRPRKDSRNNP